MEATLPNGLKVRTDSAEEMVELLRLFQDKRSFRTTLRNGMEVECDTAQEMVELMNYLDNQIVNSPSPTVEDLVQRHKDMAPEAEEEKETAPEVKSRIIDFTC